MDSREEFEKWGLDRGTFEPGELTRMEFGAYRIGSVQEKWIVWQAARERPAAAGGGEVVGWRYRYKTDPQYRFFNGKPRPFNYEQAKKDGTEIELAYAAPPPPAAPVCGTCKGERYVFAHPHSTGALFRPCPDCKTQELKT